MFVLPVTTRTNKYKQGLDLDGRFIQMAGDPRRWQVMGPNRPPYNSSQADLFHKEKKRVGEGFEIQEKG